MKKAIGICAVTLLAAALLVYAVIHTAKTNSPVLTGQVDSGVSGNTAGYDNTGVSEEFGITETDVTGSGDETLTTLISEFTSEVTERISDISAATKTVLSQTSAAPEMTKEKSGLFGRKDRESTTAAQTAAQTTTAAPSTAAPSTTAPSTKPAETTAKQGSYEYSYAGFNPEYIEITDSNWQMVLVNRHYIIRKDYVPRLEYAVKGDTNSKKLDYRVAPHYNEMYQAAAKDGIYLTTVSGYRSYELQKTNFERKIGVYMNQGYNKVAATQAAARIILPPGTSEHNAGLAMDIISLEQSFENTKAFAWLKEHAQDYGFILRYPKDKEHITEIIYEPWHWRYVGVENAKRIKASGLCLEEYLHKTP